MEENIEHRKFNLNVERKDKSTEIHKKSTHALAEKASGFSTAKKWC